MEEEEIYTVQLTKEQLLIIANTLDEASRTICGQLTTNYNRSLEHSIFIKNLSFDEKFKVRNKVDELMLEAKKIIHPEQPVSANYGVGYDELSDHMYEMYKQIRHSIEIDNPSKNYNVFKSPPLKLTDKPFIKVEKITKDILREETLNELENE
jgi:ribosome-interacting GTPase 1